MAGRTFPVHGERSLFAGRVEMMAEAAFNSCADDLGHLPLRGQMELVRKVKEYRTPLIVVWKCSHLWHLIRHDLRVTGVAEDLVLCLRVEPLGVACGAGLVAGPCDGCILLARLMAIRAFRPGLQMLTVAEWRCALDRGFGSRSSSNQPGRKVDQRRYRKRCHDDHLELRVSCHVHFQSP